MKIKKGDKVKVISGKDKGKIGIVQATYPRLNKVVVDNVNICRRHRKPTQQMPEGSITKIFAPIYVSKVALVDSKDKVFKVGYQFLDNKKIRINKKTKKPI